MSSEQIVVRRRRTLSPSTSVPVIRAPAAPFTYLAQQFSAPIEVWGFTKENANFQGGSFTLRRADNGNEMVVPWSGKDADPAAASFISGTTGLAANFFGQVNGLNAVQTDPSRMHAAAIGPDGRWMFTGAAGKGYEVADNALIKPARIQFFVLMKPGFIPDTGDGFCISAYAGTGAYWQVARYGFGLDFGYGIQAPRNGQTSGFESLIEDISGQGHRGDWHVWDYVPNTFECRHDTNVLNAGGSSVDITYPVAQKLMLFADADYNDAFRGSWRSFVAYNDVQASRDAIASFLMGQGKVVALQKVYQIDGKDFLPRYVPTFLRDAADFNNIRWWYEQGGYDHRGTTPQRPSFAKEINTVVPHAYYRVDPGDSDTIVTNAERSERGGYLGAGEAKVTKGDDWETFVQLRIGPGATQAGDWCLGIQHHYDAGASPDSVFVSFKNDQFQVVTQRNGVDTNRGSAQAFSRGVVYAFRIKGFWSAGGAADTLEVWFGVNGAALTKIVDVAASAIYSTDATLFYWKDGIYRGGANSGPIELESWNYSASKTAGAFAAYVTSQPALS